MGLCISVSKNISKLDERSQLKPKKRKVNKAAIGLPSNFQHIAHGGADGSTTHPGTTKSQLDALKNKMDDFARLLDDFDSPSKPNELPSDSSDNLLSPDNGDSKKSIAPTSVDSSIDKIRPLPSPPIVSSESTDSAYVKNDSINVTLKTIPTRTKPSSRQSVKDLFENKTVGNSAVSDDKKVKSSSKTSPIPTFPYLELPLEFENRENPVFSDDVVDIMFQDPSKSNIFDNPTSSSPVSTVQATLEEPRVSESVEPLLKDTFKSDSSLANPKLASF